MSALSESVKVTKLFGMQTQIESGQRIQCLLIKETTQRHLGLTVYGQEFQQVVCTFKGRRK